jgi:sugar lactone lactonase YvrE
VAGASCVPIGSPRQPNLFVLRKQTDRVFADLTGAEPGAADGLKVDTAGNVYCGGAGGIYILDPQGKKLGRIVHGQPATTNIGFGSDDLKTLFFCQPEPFGLGQHQDRRHPGATPEKDLKGRGEDA